MHVQVLLLKASRALFSEDNELELKQRNFRRWGITILPFLHILPLQNFLQWFQVGGNGDTKVQFSRGLIEHLDASAQSDIVRLCDCTVSIK